ncbi:MAG: hypothetical protein KC912_24295 [Proteobacteria bacterium]|nr:hypothetical protein [Pseudomonadota bacterium]
MKKRRHRRRRRGFKNLDLDDLDIHLDELLEGFGASGRRKTGGAVSVESSMDGDRFEVASGVRGSRNVEKWVILVIAWFIVGPLALLLLLSSEFRSGLTARKGSGRWEFGISRDGLRLRFQGKGITSEGVPRSVARFYGDDDGLEIPWSDLVNVDQADDDEDRLLMLETRRGTIALELRVKEEHGERYEQLVEQLRRQAGVVGLPEPIPEELSALRGQARSSKGQTVG